MSIRENIELYGSLNLEKYQQTLADEYQAKPHPSQTNAYIAEGLPFYQPKQLEDHISIMGFNMVPLPYSAIEVLLQHPELAPDDVFIRWTQEQELIFQGTLGELRRRQNG